MSNEVLGGNLFMDIPDTVQNEIFEQILITDNFFVERIISEGQSSPPDFWYDQPTSEFVILLQGEAVLEFENNEFILMKSGDYYRIEAGKKHRVDSTSLTEKTI